MLDANNNNVSPAVCVESLYYEYQTSTTSEVYRMSMKNKTLIAGDELVKSLGEPALDNIPFYTVKKLSTGNNMIYELNIDQYDLTDSFNNSMDIRLTDYYKKDDADGLYIHQKNGGVIYGQDNKLVLTSATSSNYNPNNSMYLNVDSENSYRMNFGNVGSIVTSKTGDMNITGKTLVLSTDLTTLSGDVVLGSGQSYVDINSEKLEIESDETIINSGTVSVDTTGNISLSSDSDIRINSDKNIFLNGVAWNVKSTGFVDGKYNIMQIGEDAQENIFMKNGVLPGLYIYNGGSDSVTEKFLTDEEDVSVFINQIKFASSATAVQSVNMVSSKNDMNPVTIKGIKSGSAFAPVAGTGTDNSIELVKINGQSLIGNTDIQLATPNDVSTDTTKLKIELASGSLYNVCGWENTNTTDSHDMTIVYNGNISFNQAGDLFANRVFWNSDERLKTEIGEVEITDYLPEIKQFKWKDSSVRSFGFIAQELETFYPELVHTDESGFKKVDYNAAYALAIYGL